MPDSDPRDGFFFYLTLTPMIDSYVLQWRPTILYIFFFLNKSPTLYIGRVEFKFRYVSLCDLEIPREKKNG